MSPAFTGKTHIGITLSTVVVVCLSVVVVVVVVKTG